MCAILPPSWAAPGSAVWLSNSTMAMRSTGRAGRSGVHAARTSRRPAESRLRAKLPALQYARVESEKLLELRQLLEGGKFGLFDKLLPLFKTLFEGLAHVLKSTVVGTCLGVGLGQIVVEP